MFRRTKQFFRSIVRVVWWLPTIWRDRSWDWCYLFQILEFKLRQDARYYKRHGVSMGRDRQAKELLVAAEFLKRMRESNYYANQPRIGEFSYPDSAERGFEYDDYMKAQDMNLFCKLWSGHAFGWWD